jgi:hypothetical protein
MLKKPDMNPRTALLFLLTALSIVAIDARSQVQATLVIPDTKLLPGVPFEMWIELYNPSGDTVTVGMASRALVEAEGGVSFVIDPAVSHEKYPLLLTTADGERVAYADLAPHEKRILTLPVDLRLDSCVFAEDVRISAPGRYRISVILDKFAGTESPSSFVGPVATNDVLIERVRPSGIDALVWQRMQVATERAWKPQDWRTWVSAIVRREIVTDYRESTYFPYAALVLGGDDSSAVTQLLDAINRFPRSPILDVLYIAAWRRQAAYAGGPLAVRRQVVETHLRDARRPTTRFMMFGRDDVGKMPCPPEHDCQ